MSPTPPLATAAAQHVVCVACMYMYHVSLENGSVIILVLLKCTQCVRIIYVHI